MADWFGSRHQKCGACHRRSLGQATAGLIDAAKVSWDNLASNAGQDDVILPKGLVEAVQKRFVDRGSIACAWPAGGPCKLGVASCWQWSGSWGRAGLTSNTPREQALVLACSISHWVKTVAELASVSGIFLTAPSKHQPSSHCRAPCSWITIAWAPPCCETRRFFTHARKSLVDKAWNPILATMPCPPVEQRHARRVPPQARYIN